MGKVLIKCIQTPMQKYFYDRSLDSVVMMNDEEYQILKTVEKTKLVPDGVLRRFVKSGLLRETAIEEIEHPETENLHLLAEHYMGNLILQVTQQCNLRCKYCAYSGNYYNRSHTSSENGMHKVDCCEENCKILSYYMNSYIVMLLKAKKHIMVVHAFLQLEDYLWIQKVNFFHVKEFRKKIQKCASEVWIRDLILIK